MTVYLSTQKRSYVSFFENIRPFRQHLLTDRFPQTQGKEIFRLGIAQQFGDIRTGDVPWLHSPAIHAPFKVHKTVGVRLRPPVFHGISPNEAALSCNSIDKRVFLMGIIAYTYGDLPSFFPSLKKYSQICTCPAVPILYALYLRFL